jgi:cytochrome c biogenesis protein CcdA
MPDVTILMAFAAGLISFLSPCVLPLVPGYISFVSGVTFTEIKEKTPVPSFLNREKRIVLLLVYSLGLGIPFLLTAFGINHFWRFFKRIKKYLGVLEITSGVIMVILGILIYSNKLVLIQSWLPFLNKFSL